MPPKAATVSARKRAGSAEPAPATRDVILDTAEQLFARHGVDGVALRDLARAINLSAPSLYNHFASKQALHEAVLERGLHPIAELLGAAWHPGALRPQQMRTAVDALITHLAAHPYLARLLQRALLEEGGSVQKLIAHWLTPLYREGLAVIRESAGEAGWEAEEIPHLAVGLFGMVFAHFTNAPALHTFTAGAGDPMSPQSLAMQRRFLEKAIYRLLGPQPREVERRKKP